MHTVSELISTSAHDAGITLKALRESNPQHAAQLAICLLERLAGHEGQSQRRQLALRTLRTAAKHIAADPTPDPQGPSLADVYYTLPVGDLRKVLNHGPTDHACRVGKLLTTLLQLRGEEQCDSRRKLLLAALGKSAKALAEDDGRAVA